MRSSTEVLVIGAGPVGLLLACELHRRGVDYLFGYLSGDQTKSDQGAFANLLSIIRQGLDRSAAAVAILHPQAHFVDCEMMPVLLDQDGSFQRLYFACPGMVWLVRPDGHLAWRCHRADPERLALFLDRFG